MKTPALVASFALSFALSLGLALTGSSAFAAPQKGKTAKASKSSKAQSRAKATARKPAEVAGKNAKPVKKYDFTGDNIDGQRQMPDGTTVFGVPNLEHQSLIRLRADFLPEITRAAEHI